MLDVIPVNSLLTLDGSLCNNSNGFKQHCLSGVRAPTDFKSPEAKDEFNRKLSPILRDMLSTEVVVIVGDLTPNLVT